MRLARENREYGIVADDAALDSVFEGGSKGARKAEKSAKKAKRRKSEAGVQGPIDEQGGEEIAGDLEGRYARPKKKWREDEEAEDDEEAR